MHFKRIYLDTNILIRAFEGARDDAIGQDLVGMFGLVRPEAPAPFVTSHVTLAETLVHPIRHGNVQVQHRFQLLLSSSSHWLQVRQISQSVLIEAARLRALASIKLPDAIHAATAIRTECSHILSADKDFGLTGIDDFPTPIGPDRQTVDKIIAWLRA